MGLIFSKSLPLFQRWYIETEGHGFVCQECGHHNCVEFLLGISCGTYNPPGSSDYNEMTDTHFNDGYRLDVLLKHHPYGQNCSYFGDCHCIGGHYYNYCGNFPRPGQTKPVRSGLHSVSPLLREALEKATSEDVDNMFWWLC